MNNYPRLVLNENNTKWDQLPVEIDAQDDYTFLLKNFVFKKRNKILFFFH